MGERRGHLQVEFFSHGWAAFNFVETRQPHWLGLTDVFWFFFRIHLMDVCYCGSLDLIRHPARIADWWRETCHTLYECDELIKRYGGRLKEWEIRGQCSQEPQAITCICVVCVLWLLWYLPLCLHKVRHTTTFHTIHFSPHWVTFSLNFCDDSKSLEGAVVVLLMFFMFTKARPCTMLTLI